MRTKAGAHDLRLKDFFSSGTQITWIVDPDKQFVEICHSQTERAILGPGAFLDGEHLLPGFQYPIADLFKEWDASQEETERTESQ